jgi:hypothetical protein
MKMKAYYLILPALALLVGCRDQQPAPADTTVAADPFADTLGLEESPLVTNLGEEEAQQPRLKRRQMPAPVARPKKVPSETIYVETDGAQGRVWGHVTMQGDQGRGTIHDWNENTLTVTVTRQGNELFAIDQNSRQYIFRLRK